MAQRIKTVQESDLRMLGSLARSIQRVLPVTQADIDAAAALGKGWVVTRVFEVSEPLDNLRGGTQLVIRQNSILPGQSVQRVLIVSGPGGQTVVIRGTDYIVLPDAIANSLSYVKAFGGTEQRNIPDNYIERQFIYMMDGSYLTTDIVPTYDCKIEMDFQTTSTISQAATYLSSGTALRFAHISAKTFRVSAWGNTYDSTTPVANNTRYKFIYDNLVATLKTGNTTVFTNTFTDTGTTTMPLTINGYGSPISQNVEGIYLYSFKVWNAQGELVADYVPAVQKGTVPVVGFYDTVSKTFKTATAGTFAAGGEAVPAPDTPMDIVSNNGVLKARHQSGLPLGYTLLDYIETSVSSYIDTGITPTINTKAEVKFAPTLTNTTGYWGARSDPNRFCCATFSSGTQFGMGMTTGTTWPSNRTGIVLGSVYDCVVANGYANVNGTEYTETPVVSFGNANTFCLGKIVPVSTPIYSAAKYYKCKLWENNVLVFDGIPAKNADNVIGMYDRVSGQFFTNAGSYELIAGGPVSDPVEIYADGTVETLWLHSPNLFDKAQTRQTTFAATKTFLDTHHSCYCSANVTTGSTVETALVFGNIQNSVCVPLTLGYTYRLYTYNGASANRASLCTTDENGIVIERFPNIAYATPTKPATYLFAQFANNATDTELAGFALTKGQAITEYVAYYDGGTATAKMLLKVGDYQDVQSILDGVVTRNVGVKVFDGTENWNIIPTAYADGTHRIYTNDFGYDQKTNGISTHFVEAPLADRDLPTGQQGKMYHSIQSFHLRATQFTSLEVAKQWLAAQYAAGTPVIVIYPLATPTTESVTGQTLQVTDGDNVLEITQASLNGLELEAEYQAAVSLTIQEVQDANLDPNVEVTIN